MQNITAFFDIYKFFDKKGPSRSLREARDDKISVFLCQADDRQDHLYQTEGE